MPKIISVREAAKRLEVHPTTVVRAVRAGKLKAKYSGLMKNRIAGVYETDIRTILAKQTGTAVGVK